MAEIFQLSFESVLLWCFAFFLVVQLFYLFFYYMRLAMYKKKNTSDALPPVSVIICARNEDHTLPQFLPAVLTQDYPAFEVVVVNDCSFDNTSDVLREFEKKYAHLRVITIKEDEYYTHGKKLAVTVGIKGASHETLVFTDADCRPESDRWLRMMVRNYTEGKEVVLGYGAYAKNGSLLNKLIRFDAVMIAAQYFSFALAGIPYMGVGRNLSYKKSLFFRNKGFKTHYHIESGDDDLFVNETATSKNTAVEIAPESFTVSVPKKKFSEWVQQKRRHLTTGKRYGFADKFHLGMIWFSQWMLFVCFISLLVVQFQFYIVLSSFVFRYLLQMLIFNGIFKKLHARDLLGFMPVLEIFFMVFYPVLALTRRTNKKNKWKKR